VGSDERPQERALGRKSARAARFHGIRRRGLPVRVVARLTAGGLLLAVAPALGGQDATPGGYDAAPEPARESAQVAPALELVAAKHRRSHPWRGHPGRRIVHYRVKRGDTATGLAVRFHAWTAELLALNHLSTRSTLYVGQPVRIPVVVAAARKARKASTAGKHHHARPHKQQKPHHKPAASHPKKHHAKPHRHGWRNADASRAQVRRVVVAKARRHGVSPTLALAVAWQESGWQQRRISYAGAIGVMQVLPSTGRWMEIYVGRQLHLRRLHDNVTAGVVLLRVLRSQAGPRHAVAGYYQGLAGVRKYGMYPSTRHYVANVFALKRRLAAGWNPA
jgi:LysM repeat protein